MARSSMQKTQAQNTASHRVLFRSIWSIYDVQTECFGVDTKPIAIGRLTNPNRVLAHWCIYESGVAYIYGMDDFPGHGLIVNREVLGTWLMGLPVESK